MKYVDFFENESLGMTEKSSTTYEQYNIIARNAINLLRVMSLKKKSNYSEEEKNITPSYIKSIKIGLGDKYIKTRDELEELEKYAYVYPKLRNEDLDEEDEFKNEGFNFKSLATAGLLGISSMFPMDNATADVKHKSKASSTSNKYTIQDVIASTLVDEAGGEKDAENGMRAVLNVISKRSGGDIKKAAAVCLAPRQFSGWNPVKLTDVNSVNSFINRKRSHPKYKVALSLISEMKRGELKDITKGATNFLATRVIGTNNQPKWYDKSLVTVEVGGHTFLKFK